MHCDTISKLYHANKIGTPSSLRNNSFHIDLTRMKKAGYIAQNFATYVDLSTTCDPFLEAFEMIDLLHEELQKNSDLIVFARSYDEMMENMKNQKMSAFLTLEEGAITKGSLPYLRNLYRLGARMATLTWNYENMLASPNTNYTKYKHPDVTVPFTEWGLTDVGFEIISEMEYLGMIIDVSHLSDAGFWDVLNNTQRPFVASHSNARNISSHVRNLTDDMIRAISNRGGIIGINFYPDFLSSPCSNHKNVGTLSEIVQHIKYIENIAGIDCIALGSDFDGIDGNGSLPDVSHMPKLSFALSCAGFSEDKIEKICYKNVMRVYKEILK